MKIIVRGKQGVLFVGGLCPSCTYVTGSVCSLNKKKKCSEQKKTSCRTRKQFDKKKNTYHYVYGTCARRITSGNRLSELRSDARKVFARPRRRHLNNKYNKATDRALKLDRPSAPQRAYLPRRRSTSFILSAFA